MIKKCQAQIWSSNLRENRSKSRIGTKSTHCAWIIVSKNAYYSLTGVYWQKVVFAKLVTISTATIGRKIVLSRLSELKFVKIVLQNDPIVDLALCTKYSNIAFNIVIGTFKSSCVLIGTFNLLIGSFNSYYVLLSTFNKVISTFNSCYVLIGTFNVLMRAKYDKIYSSESSSFTTK